MDRTSHWERVYAAKASTELSWYQLRPRASLQLIAAAGLRNDARFIDVGGGDSTLVDHLLDLDFRDLTVLDVSASSLEKARGRLGERASSVNWIVADVTRFLPARQYDLWHDRAVFHFLTAAEDRESYCSALLAAVPAGGQLIIATFAPQAPPRCSGLDVVRYSAESLTLEFGQDFELVQTLDELHRTPAGVSQPFTYCRFTRRAA